MSVLRPFKRTCRQFADGEYAEGGRSQYIRHPRFADSPPLQYIRAFEILQKDILELFEYIEPADINLCSYSYRIHGLLMRVCIEIETNCRVILEENGYVKRNLNMNDYKKINNSHRLSSFAIKLPVWQGNQSIRESYKSWTTNDVLLWYQAYNASKHSRHTAFQQANFVNLIDAICGLVAILSSQFYTEDFSPTDYLVTTRGLRDNFRVAIGGYFQVKFPEDWPAADRYDFNWQTLKNQPDPFEKLTF